MLSHPAELRNEMVKCENNTNNNCDEKRKILATFIELVELRSENPENFGMTILKLQMQLIEQQKQLVLHINKIETLKKDPGEAGFLNAATKDYLTLKENYLQNKERVNDMLAIIGATSSPQ